MAGRLRSVIQVGARRLHAAGSALYEAARQTHAARLLIMAARLKGETPLVAILVAATLLFCLYLGWSTGRGVHAVLLPASPTGIGATIAGVIAGSPAESAGLVAGDTITAVDGAAVESSDALSSALDAYQPGDSVTITWVSGTTGASSSATVTLIAGPAD